MSKLSSITILSPLLLLALAAPQSAVGVTAAVGDQAALTGQLLRWNEPAAASAKLLQPPADKPAAGVDAAAASGMSVDELIAKGEVRVGALLPTAPRVKASAKGNAAATHQPSALELAVAGFHGPEPKPAPEHAVLSVTVAADGLVFSPERLELPTPHDSVTLQLAALSKAQVQLFVRDQEVAGVNAEATELKAKRSGQTELYVVAKGRMYIVPIVVKDGASPAPAMPAPTLSVPMALVSLSGVVRESLASASHPGVSTATATAEPAPPPAIAFDDPLAAVPEDSLPDPSAVGELTAMNEQPKPAANPVLATAPSLRTSIAETAQALVKQEAESRRFYNAKEKIGYTTAQLQLVDDRSQPNAGVIYPVAGVTVRVLGTDFTAKTDTTGHLTIRDMPAKARFLLRIDDPSGQYRAALAELSTEGNGGVTRFKIMRSFSFDALTAIAGSVQQSSQGSYCATVHDRGEGGKLVPAAGVAVQLDAPAEGPFYFNNFGFLDRSQRATGANGRYCIFNAAPGPMAMSIFKEGAPVATVPVSMYANRHVEDDVNLTAESGFSTQLASMPTAAEQLSNDLATSTRYQRVDMIDLLPLGTDSPLPQVGPGRVALPEPLLAHQGRLRTYARAAEFEAVVYSYKAGDEQTVTPLVPRGFIEDMSLNAQVVHDPQLGTVLAEYAAPEGATQETIAMRLVDQDSKDVGDGWYFSDAPATKALFFNVPPGTYSLQVQTKDGYWLTSDTVIVYSETMSYMRLGNALKYRP